MSDQSLDHLTLHDVESVKPGSGIAFANCKGNHEGQSCFLRDAVHSSSRQRLVRLELTVHQGTAYPGRSVPTLVIGEPCHLTFRLVNSGKNAIHYPPSATTAYQWVTVHRFERGRSVTLTPPAMCCDASPHWQRLAPGKAVEIHESLFYRNGKLVFPRDGDYVLVARIWIRSRWITSEPRLIRVLPPSTRRHFRSIEIAQEPEIGVLLELGGGDLRGHGVEALRRLLRDNPAFPLNSLGRLVVGRRAVFEREYAYPSWKQSLHRVQVDTRQPWFLRREAELLIRAAEGGLTDEPDSNSLEEQVPLCSARRIGRLLRQQSKKERKI